MKLKVSGAGVSAGGRSGFSIVFPRHLAADVILTPGYVKKNKIKCHPE